MHVVDSGTNPSRERLGCEICDAGWFRGIQLRLQQPWHLHCTFWCLAPGQQQSLVLHWVFSVHLEPWPYILPIHHPGQFINIGINTIVWLTHPIMGILWWSKWHERHDIVSIPVNFGCAHWKFYTLKTWYETLTDYKYWSDIIWILLEH